MFSVDGFDLKLCLMTTMSVDFVGFLIIVVTQTFRTYEIIEKLFHDCDTWNIKTIKQITIHNNGIPN